MKVMTIMFPFVLLVLTSAGSSLAAPGDPDTSFSYDGRVTTDFGGGAPDIGYAVAIQADGKIVVAGYSEVDVTRDFALARYNPDGSLDTSFSYNGIVTTDFGGLDYGNAVALQTDGKIVVAGRSGGYDFALARYYAGLWSVAVDVGGGWRWLNWFGYFNLNNDPWIYHMEHGSLYPFGTSTDSIVFWDAGMNAFWWTSDINYPYLYRFSDGEWLWYLEGSTNPRWFMRLSSGTWEQW